MEWKISKELVNYPDAVSFMEDRVSLVNNGRGDECVWLLEHPSLYTAGTSAKEKDLLDNRFPVYKTGRGGQYTYHGPGQRVAYIILNLKQRQQVPDIKRYIYNLEEWIIRTIARFGIKGMRREGRVGIWVNIEGGKEAKIAAIGVRVRHWISFHGVAINVNPDLSNFDGIVPCGISEHGVTSFKNLGIDIKMEHLDEALKEEWGGVFDS